MGAVGIVSVGDLGVVGDRQSKEKRAQRKLKSVRKTLEVLGFLHRLSQKSLKRMGKEAPSSLFSFSPMQVRALKGSSVCLSASRHSHILPQRGERVDRRSHHFGAQPLPSHA